MSGSYKLLNAAAALIPGGSSLSQADRLAAARDILELAMKNAAPPAQVQDDNEIVDCLMAGKPFVFDPATNFCHAVDGGAPEHGIKYVPAAQVQDVDIDDGRPCVMDVFAAALQDDCDDPFDRWEAIVEWLHGDWDAALSYLKDETRARITLAKQEGGHDAPEEE